MEKLLDSMTRIELYELPSAEPWQLETFLDKVKERCKEGSKELHKRSAMVEDAIEDLISLALEFKPGVEVTDGDLNSMVIAKSPREDLEEEGRSHHRRKRGTESPGGGGQDEDITVMPSQPTHLLSVLDR